jgi:NADPH-dependent 7-cyano-7-deazaguanine reductase QueF-like protein
MLEIRENVPEVLTWVMNDYLEKFDKTLTTNISRQSRNSMTIISANAANFYNRVNHVIMSLIWLTLLNGSIPSVVVALICLQTMRFFQ